MSMSDPLNHYGSIQILHMSPILQTSFLVWIFLAISYSKPALEIPSILVHSDESKETIHLRRQHVLGGRGVPMARWSKGHST